MTKNQEAERRGKEDYMLPSVTADAAPRESANAGAASRYVAPPIWPNGCIKPGSCSKDTSRRCMYARTREQCPHVDRDIGPEIDAERTRRDRVSDGSPQGQDAKRLDPKDESAAVPAETPHSLPPNPSGFGELVERLKHHHVRAQEMPATYCATGADIFKCAATAIETQAAEIEKHKEDGNRLFKIALGHQDRAEKAEARIAELEREVAIHKGNADDIYAKWAEERDRRVGAESRLAEAVKVIEPFARFAPFVASRSRAVPVMADTILPDGPTYALEVEHFQAASSFLSTTGGDNG